MTTTTLKVAGFRDELLAALQDRLGDVQVAHAWLGPDTEHEGIYLVDLITGEGPAGRLAPAALTAGRQRLDETSVLPVTCRSWRAAATPQDGVDGFDRCFELFAHVIDELQDNPAMSQTIDWSDAIDYRSRITPFENGWAADVVGLISVKSRLL